MSKNKSQAELAAEIYANEQWENQHGYEWRLCESDFRAGWNAKPNFKWHRIFKTAVFNEPTVLIIAGKRELLQATKGLKGETALEIGWTHYALISELINLPKEINEGNYILIYPTD